MIELALLLGKTLQELSNLTPLELRLWETYLSVNPCGEYAKDLRTAQIVSVLTRKPIDKVLLVKNRRNRQSKEDDIIRQLEKVFNGSV